MKNIEERNEIKNLASLVLGTLQNAGIDAVLAGGSCVSIYSKGKYASGEPVFAVNAKIEDIEEALEPIGFKKAPGAYFEKYECGLVLEFQPLAAALGKVSHSRKSGVPRVATGNIQILSRTDCIKVDLAEFFLRKDRVSLEQSVQAAKSGIFDLKEVERWSKHEGHFEKLREFIAELGKK